MLEGSGFLPLSFVIFSGKPARGRFDVIQAPTIGFLLVIGAAHGASQLAGLPSLLSLS